MASASLPALYFHTLRHLRWEQVWRRLWFRLRRPRPMRAPVPMLRPMVTRWTSCKRPASMTGPRRFRFLGVEKTLSPVAGTDRNEWERIGPNRLWRYNLHYFDDLCASEAGQREGWHRDLVEDWIACHPPHAGTGWEPYPSSLRIVNWAKWIWSGQAPSPAMQASMAKQAHALSQRLEFHLLGNHLWANAKALVFAGCCFEGSLADEWRRCGLELLQRELAEQILPDGGHFERSPMYHAIVLEDVFDLVQLAGLFPGLFDVAQVAAWRDAAPRMLRWLRVMSHPDGGISFFNDAAFDIAPELADLDEYARKLGVSVADEPLADIESLPDSGYVRLQAGEAVLIADVGEIGPDYLPGHAHADTLSFELSLRGRRVLVNGGTSTYEVGDERLHQRGTAAHNAVVVAGEDSSEVWSSFRVARRARPSAVEWGRDGDGLYLQAAHDGYRRLRGIALTHRRWRLEGRSLRVEDRVEGGPVSAFAHYHLHPDGRIVAMDANGGDIEVGDIRIRLRAEPAASVAVHEDRWHPRFGEAIASRCFEVGLSAGTAQVRLDWD